MEKQGRPWWLYLNLLGLDAPLIAVTWLFLFAKTWRVNYHPWEAYVALGLVVWTIRISAKLLESAMGAGEASFVIDHQKILKRVAVISGVVSIGLTILNFPLSVYAYLLVGGVLVLGFFALALFSGKEENEISYARHALAGVSFAYGTALMAHVYLPNLGIKELLFSREFICFSLLCLIASAATQIWSEGSKSTDHVHSVSDEITVSLPLTLLGAAALIFAVQNETMAARPFFYGILTGAALLQVLNRTRSKFETRTVKILTAVCLLIPGLIFQAYLRSQ